MCSRSRQEDQGGTGLQARLGRRSGRVATGRASLSASSRSPAAQHGPRRNPGTPDPRGGCARVDRSGLTTVHCRASHLQRRRVRSSRGIPLPTFSRSCRCEPAASPPRRTSSPSSSHSWQRVRPPRSRWLTGWGSPPRSPDMTGIQHDSTRRGAVTRQLSKREDSASQRVLEDDAVTSGPHGAPAVAQEFVSMPLAPSPGRTAPAGCLATAMAVVPATHARFRRPASSST